METTIDGLAEEFDGVLPRDAIELRARSKLEEFHGARIVVFLPILVGREVREQLRREAPRLAC